MPSLRLVLVGRRESIYFMIETRGEQSGHPEANDRAGSIRHVIIRNVIAHGQGTCLITGHPTSWLDDVSLENVKLFISTNPNSPYDKSVDAMHFQYAKNLKVQDVEVNWEKPAWEKWQSALSFENVSGLKVDGFLGGPAKPGTDQPAIVLNNVENAAICNSQARPGTQVFLNAKGPAANDHLSGNELHDVAKPFVADANVTEGAVKAVNSF